MSTRFLLAALLLLVVAAVVPAADLPPTIATTAAATPAVIVGRTTQLTVIGTDDGGAAALIYTWTATGPAAVAVSPNGTNAAKTATATFIAPGTYTLTARIADVQSQFVTSAVTVTVVSTPTSMDTVSTGTGILNPGQTKTFTGVVYNQFGTVVTAPGPVTWSMASGSGSINASGVYTAALPTGFAMVRGICGTLTNTAQVQVNAVPTVASVVSTASTTITSATAAFDVQGADDQSVDLLNYTWTATGPAAVTFSPANSLNAEHTVATFTALGTYTITARIADKQSVFVTSSLTVTVVSKPTSMDTVSTGTGILNPGQTKTFTGVVYNQFGTAVAAPAPVTWSMASGSGSISAFGVYTAALPTGFALVRGTCGTLTNTAQVQVNAVPTVAAAVSTASTTITSATAAFDVQGADDQSVDLLNYTWTATGPAAVSFSPANSLNAEHTVATFIAPGNYLISARIADKQSVATFSTLAVTVVSTATAVTIAPAAMVLNPNATQAFTVTAKNQFAAVMAVPPACTWSTTGGVSVTPAGVVTAGVTPGAASVQVALTSTPAILASSAIRINAAPTVVQAVHTDGSPMRVGIPLALAVEAVDDDGEANLTYAWSVASGATSGVSFSANGSHAAKNTNVTISQVGTYTFQVLITDAQGRTVTSSVVLGVNQVLNQIVVAPAGATVVVGQAKMFTAVGTDATGMALAIQPAWNWTVSGGGSMAANGQFTAGSTSGGSYAVTASAAGVSGSATVQVIDAKLTLLSLTAVVDATDARVVRLHAEAVDGSGIGNLTYTWSLADIGFDAPEFSANGTVAAHTISARMAHAGVWNFKVVVRNSAGVQVAGDVAVQVPSKIAQVLLSLGSASVPVAGQVTVSTLWKNQFGDVVAVPADALWTTAGGRVIEGRLLVAGVHGGAFPLTVSSGTLSTGVVSATMPLTVVNTAPVFSGQPSALASGEGAYLEALASDDGGAAQLTYQWTVSSGPAGAKILPVTGGGARLIVTGPGTWVCQVTVRDADGLSVSANVSTAVVAVAQSLAIQTDTIGLSAGQVHGKAVIGDAWGNTLPNTGVVWTAAGGSITAAGVATATGTGVMTMTATLNKLTATVVYDPTAPGNTDTNPPPVPPQVSLEIVDGLAGDQRGSENGEAVCFTNRDSITVQVLIDSTAGAVTDVRISGTADGATARFIGEQSVTLVDGISHLQATVTIATAQGTATASSALMAVLCDRTAPVVYIGRTDAVDAANKPRPITQPGLCYLNGMSEGDNTANAGAAWTTRLDRFSRDTFQAVVVAQDAHGLSHVAGLGSPLIAQADVAQASVELTTAASGSTTDPNYKKWLVSGFSRLQESETFATDHRGSPHAGLYRIPTTVTDRCGNSANASWPTYWVKTVPPQGTPAYIPADMPISALTPEQRGQTFLTTHRWVIADGDVVGGGGGGGGPLFIWGNKLARFSSQKPPMILDLGVYASDESDHWPTPPDLIDIAGNHAAMGKPSAAVEPLPLCAWPTPVTDVYHIVFNATVAAGYSLSETPSLGDSMIATWASRDATGYDTTGRSAYNLGFTAPTMWPFGWQGYVSSNEPDFSMVLASGVGQGMTVDELIATQAWTATGEEGVYDLTTSFEFSGHDQPGITSLIGLAGMAQETDPEKYVAIMARSAAVARSAPSWITQAAPARPLAWMQCTRIMSEAVNQYHELAPTFSLAGSPQPVVGSIRNPLTTPVANGTAYDTWLEVFSVIDPEYPGVLEWSAHGQLHLQLSDLFAQELRDDVDGNYGIVTPPAPLTREVTYRWLEAPTLRPLSIAPDLVTTGSRVTMTARGNILGLRFVLGGQDLTITNAQYADATITSEERAGKIAVAEVVTHQVSLGSKTYQVIDSVTVDIGNAVPTKFLDVDVLLLPDQVEVDRGLAATYPADIAKKFHGEYPVIATSTADGSGDAPSAGTNGVNRMKEALQVIGFEMVTEGTNGEPEAADFTTNVSDPRPTVALTVTDRYLSSDGTASVTVRAEIADPLSEVMPDPAKRVQSVTFSVNGQVVETITGLPAQGGQAAGGLFHPFGFKPVVTHTFNLGKVKPGAYTISAETGANAAGNTGFDSVTVPVLLKTKAETSTPSTAGSLAGLIARLDATAAMSETVVDTLTFPITIDGVSKTVTLTETSAASHKFTGAIESTNISVPVEVRVSGLLRKTPGVVDTFFAMVGWAGAADQGRTAATFVETGPDTGIFSMNLAVAGPGGVPRKISHETVFGDVASGQRSDAGNYEPYVFRAFGPLLYEPNQGGLKMKVGGEAKTLKPFTFSPEKFYVVQNDADGHPVVYVIIGDSAQLPPGFKPNLIRVQNQGDALVATIGGSDADELGNFEVTVLDENDIGSVDCSGNPVEITTMENLLAVFQFMEGDKGLALLQFYLAGGNRIELGNVLGDSDLDGWQILGGGDGQLVIQIEKDLNPVTAAQYLWAQLDASTAYMRTRLNDDFAALDPASTSADAALEGLRNARNAALAESGQMAASVANMYLGGLTSFNVGADIVLTVSDVWDGNYFAAVGLVPFVGKALSTTANLGKKVIVKTRAGRLLASFTSEQATVIRAVQAEPTLEGKLALLRTSGLFDRDSITLLIRGGAVCFTAETPVWTAKGTKPIGDIRIGDRVRAWDEAHRVMVTALVTEIFRTEAQQVYQVSFSDGSSVECTSNHPFYVEEAGWIPAVDLEAGMRLRSITGSSISVRGPPTPTRIATVHNIEVAGAHTYFVGQDGVLVHNKCAAIGSHSKLKQGMLAAGNNPPAAVVQAATGTGRRVEAHHVFPYSMASEFFKRGLNVNDPKYGIWLVGGRGQSRGFVGNTHTHWSSAYNREWELWFRQVIDPLEARIKAATGSGITPQRFIQEAEQKAKQLAADIRFDPLGMANTTQANGFISLLGF